jgi:hypothetical protein
MMNDAVAGKDLSESIETRDIAEIVADALMVPEEASADA